MPRNNHPAPPYDKLPRFLTALPVYNERQHVTPVLDEVVKYATDVLVVDDGSTDGTLELLEGRGDIHLIRHEQNRGYGAALNTAFEYAIVHRYDLVVTIDCDGQHEPQRIGQLVAACADPLDGGADIVSGSRYLDDCDGRGDSTTGPAPADRRQINMQTTEELNRLLNLNLTDTFCGFKAYQVASLARLQLTETGYAMPLELWVQAAYHSLRIVELPVPLIYLDEERSFGGALDDASTRIDHYHQVIDRAVRACGGPAVLQRSTRQPLVAAPELCGKGSRPCS